MSERPPFAGGVGEFLGWVEPPWTGAPAGHELAEEPGYVERWGDHPLVHIALVPVGLLTHVADHLTGIAAVMRAPETVMTYWTLSRAGLASCATAFNLLEPDVGVGERLRRAMNVTLRSYVEQLNMATYRACDLGRGRRARQR